MNEQIRVLRVIEYSGDRKSIETHLKHVLYGEKTINGRDGDFTIKAATIGVVPDILAAPTPESTGEFGTYDEVLK